MSGVSERRFGSSHHHFRRTDSTNERARALAEAGAADGSVVTADEQSAGRGRRGRRWSAPAGAALLYSAILRPLGLEHSLLPLSAPLAVCDAIEAVGAASCQIKWPNDVWLDGRKVAGVLIEARPPEWAVIGIGINVAIEPDAFPADLRWPATSVEHGVETAAMLDALCACLDAWVGADPGAILAAFRERDALAGREVQWADGSGVASGIDDDGDLLVETDAGDRVALGAGEVQLKVSPPSRPAR